MQIVQTAVEGVPSELRRIIIRSRELEFPPTAPVGLYSYLDTEMSILENRPTTGQLYNPENPSIPDEASVPA